MTEAYINRVATAVPPFEVHQAFQEFAYSLFPDNRRVALFKRMASLSGIEQRYSVLADGEDPEGKAVNAHEFYIRGQFPDTAARMRLFEQFSPALAEQAVRRLNLGGESERITHLLITCCTGFSAPGLDFELVERCNLPSSVERTIIAAPEHSRPSTRIASAWIGAPEIASNSSATNSRPNIPAGSTTPRWLGP